MLCAISGESPQDPVISPRSGSVFERRLIESHIQQNGKDPVTDEELAASDLIAVKTSRTVKPRPPTLTSIPSLLSVFQNEWDALALETFNLRQHLTQIRQELSNALYENDAAKRVIARLQRERDEARDALSKVSIDSTRSGVNGDAMQVDKQELSEELVAKVEATRDRLSKTRRKRPVPEDWATSEDVQSFVPAKTSKPLYAGVRHIATDGEGDHTLLGGSEGNAGVYSLSQAKLIDNFDLGAPVTDSLWVGSTVVAATAAGNVTLFDGGEEKSSFQAHNGEVTAISLHPSGELLASVGTDKTYTFYDLTSQSKALQIATDAGLSAAQFHPDGHLFAAGGVDGQIKLFDVKTGANAANFEESGPVEALDFSENGTWLAVMAKESTSVSIWDLRKMSKIKDLEMGGPVVSLKWDYTGQFLAGAGPGGLTVQAYDKGNKEWSTALQTAVPGTAIAWGPKGKSLIVVNETGVITELAVKG